MGIQRYGWGSTESFGWLGGDRGEAAFVEPPPPPRRSLLAGLGAPVKRSGSDEDDSDDAPPVREKKWRRDGKRVLKPDPARRCLECGDPMSPCSKRDVHRRCEQAKAKKEVAPKGVTRAELAKR